jgi:hypothetical protein
MMSELQLLGDFQAVSRRAVTVRLYSHDCKVVSLEYGCWSDWHLSYANCLGPFDFNLHNE